MDRKAIGVGIGAVVLLGIVSAVLFVTRSPSLLGAVIEPPWPAPELSLTDHNGKPFSMSAERGKVVLLYFGYINCPDECPLTMAHLKLALDSLGPRAADVQVVMVSTDPVRDTPQALKVFMERFDPSFLGLTGTAEQLQKAWRDYGVTVEHGGETHSPYLFVVDPGGEIRETFLPDSEPSDIASDVSWLLSQK